MKKYDGWCFKWPDCICETTFSYTRTSAWENILKSHLSPEDFENFYKSQKKKKQLYRQGGRVVKVKVVEAKS